METSFKKDLITRMSRAARKMCLADEEISRIYRDLGYSDEDIDKIINCKPLPRRPQNKIPIIKKWNSAFDLRRLLSHHDAEYKFYDAVIEGKVTPYDKDGLVIIDSENNPFGPYPPGCRYERINHENVYDFFYTAEDIEAYLNSTLSNSHENISPKNEVDPEEFLRNLRVSYRDDETVTIQEPGKEKKPYSFSSMYFKNSKTKEWKSFLDIIKRPDLSYDLGKSHKYHDEGSGIKKRFLNRDYSNNHDRWRAIDRKLKRFFETEFAINIPQNIHIYYNVETEKHGIYKLKFKPDTVIDAVAVDAKKEEVMRMIKQLSHKREIDNLTPDEFIVFADHIETAREHGYMTDDEIKDLHQENDNY